MKICKTILTTNHMKSFEKEVVTKFLSVMLHVDVNASNTEHLKPTLHIYYSKQKFLFFFKPYI